MEQEFKKYLKLKIEKGRVDSKTFNYKQRQNQNYKPGMIFLSVLKPRYYFKQQFFSGRTSPQSPSASAAVIPASQHGGCLVPASLQVRFVGTKRKS